MSKHIVKFMISWREALIGIMIACILILLTETAIRNIRSYIPPTYFFEVHQLFVPDFEPYDNPLIIYEYSVKQPFYGSYSVTVQRIYQNGATELIPICRGSGSKMYEDVKFVIPSEASLSWFINENCAFDPGLYQLSASWQISTDRYPTKTYHRVSNIFEVF
jgi:hypothetical protein